MPAFLQKVGFAFCAKKRVSIGGNPKARIEAIEFAEAFMRRHLKEK